MPSHDDGWEFSDVGKLAIDWMTGSQMQLLFWGCYQANAGVLVRLQTASALSEHSNAHTFVVSRTALE